MLVIISPLCWPSSCHCVGHHLAILCSSSSYHSVLVIILPFSVGHHLTILCSSPSYYSMFTWSFVPFTSDLPTGNIKDHEDNVNLPTVRQVREQQTYPQVENNQETVWTHPKVKKQFRRLWIYGPRDNPWEGSANSPGGMRPAWGWMWLCRVSWWWSRGCSTCPVCTPSHPRPTAASPLPKPTLA